MDLQVFDGFLIDRDTGEVTPFDPRMVTDAQFQRAFAELDAPVRPSPMERDESGDEP